MSPSSLINTMVPCANPGAPASGRNIRLSSVVLPLPRNPEMTVTGILPLMAGRLAPFNTTQKTRLVRGVRRAPVHGLHLYRVDGAFRPTPSNNETESLKIGSAH